MLSSRDWVDLEAATNKARESGDWDSLAGWYDRLARDLSLEVGRGVTDAEIHLIKSWSSTLRAIASSVQEQKVYVNNRE
jgi:hypothetical protein